MVLMRARVLAAVSTAFALTLWGCERSAPPKAAETHHSAYDHAEKLSFYWDTVPTRVQDAAWEDEAGLVHGDLALSREPQVRVLLAAARQAYSLERLRALRATVPDVAPATKSALDRLGQVTRVERPINEPRLWRLAQAMPETALFTEAQLAKIVWARGLEDMRKGAPAAPDAALARAAKQVARARTELADGKLRERVPNKADEGLVQRLAALSRADQDTLARAFLEVPGRADTARMLAAFRAANDAAMTDALSRAYAASNASVQAR